MRKQIITLNAVYPSPFHRPRVVKNALFQFGDGLTRGSDYAKNIGDFIIKMFEENPNLSHVLVTRKYVMKKDEGMVPP